jgi:hypothetical protein
MGEGNLSERLGSERLDQFVAGLDGRVRAVLEPLRTGLQKLDGVTEGIKYDGMAGEWTPVAYVGSRQLFHVHIKDGIHGVMTVTPGEAPAFLAASLPEGIKPAIRQGRARARTWLSVPLRSLRDVTSFMKMVAIKHRLLREASVPRRRAKRAAPRIDRALLARSLRAER